MVKKSFVYGMVSALLLVTLLGASNAFEYLHDNVEMGTSAVSGVATPTALSDGATKGYVDSAATFSCTWESVSTVCNSNTKPCYANKPTADKVCQDKGYQYASTYTFLTSPGSSPDYYWWTGSSWVSATPSEDSGYGGGVASTGSLSNGEYISYALCCE